MKKRMKHQLQHLLLLALIFATLTFSVNVAYADVVVNDVSADAQVSASAETAADTDQASTGASAVTDQTAAAASEEQKSDTAADTDSSKSSGDTSAEGSETGKTDIASGTDSSSDTAASGATGTDAAASDTTGAEENTDTANKETASTDTGSTDTASTDTANAETGNTDTASTDTDTTGTETDTTDEPKTPAEPVTVVTTETTSKTVYTVTASSLNVRKGAGTSYKKVGTVKKGYVVTVSATKKVKSTTWAKITYKNITGWASMKYIKKTTTTSVKTTYTTTYPDGSVSVYITYGKNGWYKENSTWKYYKNDSVAFSSNYMYTAFKKIEKLSSGTDYYLVVDRAHFYVYAFHMENGSWVPYKAMKCDVGMKGHETPTGTFSIFSRWGILESSSSWEYYPVEFESNYYGTYCFHSVLYYKGTALKNASKAKVKDGRLGYAISHGCVRLSLDNSKWIYNNCANGTKVLIY